MEIDYCKKVLKIFLILRCLIYNYNIWLEILRLSGALQFAGFRSIFYSTEHYHGNDPFPYFFLSPGKFKLSETQKVFKKRN